MLSVTRSMIITVLHRTTLVAKHNESVPNRRIWPTKLNSTTLAIPNMVMNLGLEVPYVAVAMTRGSGRPHTVVVTDPSPEDVAVAVQVFRQLVVCCWAKHSTVAFVVALMVIGKTDTSFRPILADFGAHKDLSSGDKRSEFPPELSSVFRCVASVAPEIRPFHSTPFLSFLSLQMDP
jgi:hypothetical protein